MVRKRELTKPQSINFSRPSMSGAWARIKDQKRRAKKKMDSKSRKRRQGFLKISNRCFLLSGKREKKYQLAARIKRRRRKRDSWKKGKTWRKEKKKAR